MPISPIQMTRSALLDALAEGAVVATGNARLARSLAVEFDRRMLAQGRSAWGTPAVLPWSSWLLDLFAAAAVRGAATLPAYDNRAGGAVWVVIRQDG
jgi:hypothetical protein